MMELKIKKMKQDASDLEKLQSKQNDAYGSKTSSNGGQDTRGSDLSHKVFHAQFNNIGVANHSNGERETFSRILNPSMLE